MPRDSYRDLSVDTSHEGRVVRVTLDRPEKMNALSSTLLGELGDCLSWIEEESDARVVVFTGAGRAFSAGYDLSPGDEDEGTDGEEGDDGSERTAYDDFRYEQRNYDLMKRVWDFPLPTVGAVDGYALAGGFELSQMLDIVIAAEGAEFGYPISRGTGTPPMFFLPFVVDTRTARELLLTGRHVPAEEAASIGLANRVVPPGQLDDAVEEMLERLLRVPSDLAYLNKRLMNRTLDIMGYSSAIEQGHDVHITGHTAPSVVEFGRRVEEEGLEAALAWRDEAVKD